MAKIINIKNEVLIRVYIVGFMVVLAALVIIGRTAQIQFVEGQEWKDMRDSLVIEEIPVAEHHLLWVCCSGLYGCQPPYYLGA